MPQTLANTLPPERAIGQKSSINKRWDAPGPMGLWHLTSLDAPTVAAVWALGFGWAAEVRLPAWIPCLLALTAWAVYIADRLLDARLSLRSGEVHQLRLRHRFHWRHRRILIPVGIGAAYAAAWMVLAWMSPGARERNSVLAAAGLAYFAGVHSRDGQAPMGPRFLSKELLVGVLFTTACVLPVWARLPGGHPAWTLLIPAAFFALLAWLNCHAIEQWESDREGSRGQAVHLLGCALGLIGVVAAAILAPTETRTATLIMAGAFSALLLALLDRVRGRLTPLAIRAFADLALLTPVLLLPVSQLRR